MQYPPQVEQAFALVKAGRPQEAVRHLRVLADRGDGPASYQLAEWHREGEHAPRDFAAARELYRRSAQAGLIEGMRRYLALWVLGIGGDRDWPAGLQLLEAMTRVDPRAARELALVRKMRLDAAGDPVAVPAAEVLNEEPRLVRFANLFTDEECAYLAAAAEPLFEPANTYNERTGEDFRNSVRTSDTAAFPWVGENPAVHALNRRIAAASGTDVAHGEPLQVLRYEPGQEYKPHIDAIPGLDNQRVLTMLVYLNDGFEGGETHFPDLGMTVAARRGDAILFRNVTADGRPNPAIVHAGLPVRSGVKLLASRWIRERRVTG
jgi:prolyl 4-hydroxylase